MWVLVDAQIVNIIMNNGFYYILICNIILFWGNQEIVDSIFTFLIQPWWVPVESLGKMRNKPDGCFTQNPIYVVIIGHLKVELEPHKNCNTKNLQGKKGFPEVPLQHNTLCLCCFYIFYDKRAAATLQINSKSKPWATLLLKKSMWKLICWDIPKGLIKQ